MPTPPHRLLSVAVVAALALAAPPLSAMNAQADPSRWTMCSGRMAFDWLQPLPAQLPPREDTPADLSAERFDVSGQDRYVLEGAVELERADQRLTADRLEYTHSSSAWRADGDVRYRDRDIALTAQQAFGVLADDVSRLDDVEYQLIGLRGRGNAAAVDRAGPVSTLDQVGYTTCDPGDAGWRLFARRIELDHDEGVGRARDATLRIGNVPVLWLPYASFPIDERRRSGFLYPVLGSNDGSIDLQVPYYLNLAPHYDATLTPRLLGRRGLMLGGEFRWLGEIQRGELHATWMPDDRLADRSRGSASLRHDARLGAHWDARTHLNHVSDPRYFEDFGDSLTTISTALLESSTGLYGRGLGWQASLVAQAWDITDPFIPTSAEPFRRLPRAVAQWSPVVGPDWLDVGIAAEAVAFDHSERPGARRWDLRPWFALPFERAWGFARPEVAFRHTGYDLDRDWLDAGFPRRDPRRSLPIYSFDAGLLFERDTAFGGRRLLQTLQPRLYYLYVPFEDQADLPIFDTHELSYSFAQLFRPNRFSGADRQMDANQATLAVTSRWLDADRGVELGSVSLGQIRYFDPQRVQMPGRDATDHSASAWVAEVEAVLSPRWRIGVVQHWDPELDATTLSGLRAQWRAANGTVANLAYRYRRDRLEQIDSSFTLPLASAWRLVGRWNYSLRDDSTLEAFGGFEWEGCCVAVRALGRRYVRNREGDRSNAIFFEVELKGLASLGRRAGDFLERAILGYTQ